ncbi:DUF937 domain-containing protein [Qipengyuania marisflavi]|uniref:DUF937 domain-containing protein n=1 Tax=Qipengyuania marisflavi TaxID=2486356 RepID=A0A5S3P8U9_9SPHN|nr:DUF937 domain-containing protein [Qipengyuania marisflavi]TMM48864.1 DUF937 domain-containing protein [Qipengyuania marisflavi]
MNLAQTLQQDGVFDSMARELNIDPQTAQSAAGALLPAIVAGLGRSHVGAGGSRTAAGGGLGDLLGGVLGGGAGGGGMGGGLLEQVLGGSPTPKQPGNDILGQIFGSKDVSRGVAEEVSGSTGIPATLLKQMLPMLAMAVVGHMMKGKGGAMGGALGGILGQVVTGMMRGR